MNGGLIKGRCAPTCGVFADYLVRYVQAYAAEACPSSHSRCRTNRTSSRAISRHAARLRRTRVGGGQTPGPQLQQLGLKTQLIEVGPNWDDPAAPLAMLSDPVARPFVAGVAWHCYAGEAKAQQLVRDTHPDKDTWFTECSGGEWKTNWAETLPWLVRNVLIGSTRYGAARC
ncbi:MAG: hypothetical protein IPP44_14220 [Ideonella sp.]|nr:hypothetical protein [Ideonella sp.]